MNFKLPLSKGPEYLNATINGSTMFEITDKLQQTTNGVSTIPTSTCQMDSVEELSYVPGLSDILNTPFQDTARKRQRQDESEQNVRYDMFIISSLVSFTIHLPHDHAVMISLL